MFELFKFRLPVAVTGQLIDKLEGLRPSLLTTEALAELKVFVVENDMRSGVYVLYLDGKAVYAGKAEHVVDRLRQHLRKLSGRMGLIGQSMSYKALVLDENWSTSANENLLIDYFRDRGECEWNGGGFGPKDVGAHRDDYQPNRFDTLYPINTELVVEGLEDRTTLAAILKAMKTQLPYLLRYKLDADNLSTEVDLHGVSRTAASLAGLTARLLGPDYQFVVFASHMTLYKSKKVYAFGVVLPST